MGALSVVPKNMLTGYPQVWDLSPRASKLSVETRGAILGGPSRTPMAIGLKTWLHRCSGAYPNRSHRAAARDVPRSGCVPAIAGLNHILLELGEKTRTGEMPR